MKSQPNQRVLREQRCISVGRVVFQRADHSVFVNFRTLDADVKFGGEKQRSVVVDVGYDDRNLGRLFSQYSGEEYNGRKVCFRRI